MRMIASIKRVANVDENRIFTTGFSDGGSGSFYVAAGHATPFAGILPMNGHPVIAAAFGEGQVGLANLANRPMYFVVTQDDQLYPAADLLPYTEAFMRAGVKLWFTSYPEGGHTPVYREDQDPLMARWVTQQERDPMPTSIAWRSAHANHHRYHWLRIDELGRAANEASFDEPNVMSRPGRVRLGINLKANVPGIVVEVVAETSTAAAIGMEPGDAIVEADGTPLADVPALIAWLGTKRYGDALAVTVLRGDTRLVLTGQIPPFTPQPSYRSSAPSGRVNGTITGNTIALQTQGVRALTILVSSDQFDLTSEIVVTANGAECFRGTVATSTETMLRHYAHDWDRSMIYDAEITVRLPSPE
jgi:membrane-associated protease RseP (regulator of RpoE activity)